MIVKVKILIPVPPRRKSPLTDMIPENRERGLAFTHEFIPRCSERMAIVTLEDGLVSYCVISPSPI